MYVHVVEYVHLIHMYVHVCTCSWICVCVHVYIHVCLIHVCVYVCILMCVSVHTYVYLICVCMHVYVFEYVYVCACTYMYLNMCVHEHVHRYPSMAVWTPEPAVWGLSLNIFHLRFLRQGLLLRLGFFLTELAGQRVPGIHLSPSLQQQGELHAVTLAVPQVGAGLPNSNPYTWQKVLCAQKHLLARCL